MRSNTERLVGGHWAGGRSNKLAITQRLTARLPAIDAPLSPPRPQERAQEKERNAERGERKWSWKNYDSCVPPSSTACYKLSHAKYSRSRVSACACAWMGGWRVGRGRGWVGRTDGRTDGKASIPVKPAPARKTLKNEEEEGAGRVWIGKEGEGRKEAT